MKRLLPHAIPRQQKLPSPCIPERKSPHAIELLLAVKAPLFVCGYDDLGVRRGHKVIPETAQILPELDIVIELAVKNDDHVSIAAIHWLASRREIDDCQAPMSKADVSVLMVALAIRPAMRKGAGHAAQRVTIDSPSLVLMQDSSDSAHVRRVESVWPKLI